MNRRIFLFLFLFIAIAVAAAQPARAQLGPQEALRQLRPAEGLRVQLFAHEPQVYAPTAIDVDEQGRVWVVEGINYRKAGGPRTSEFPYFLKPLRKSGDRVLVMEDEDGDGFCDTSRVFYEGLDINSPQGFAVFGGKVWISQSPRIFTIEIKPDGTAGKQETFLTGFGGVHGDHSVHSVYLGPDGRLYGCFGNTHTVLELPDGRKIDNWTRANRGGVVFRMNLDRSGFEVLGHNFRNGYECATDSFGTTFYSDNDDDEGNQYCRLVYVMQGGNFGHQPQPPRGLDWNMETPGVVPILLRMGAGAPAGLCVYEGTMLPEKYHGMPMLAETGSGELFCFRLSNDGAGFRVAGAAVDDEGRQTIATLRQTRDGDVLLASEDRWYRPSDVAVAPDGSVFVADFYNHIAGGRKLDDDWRGRIYRLSAADHDESYRPGNCDVASDKGLIAALASPNLARRAKAILRIREKGAAVIPLLASQLNTPDRRLKARLLFQLASLPAAGQKHVVAALENEDSDVRIAALRALDQHQAASIEVLGSLVNDKSPQVRRELLLALRDAEQDACRELLLALAEQYDGYDRFYLEALLLALDGKEQVREEIAAAMKDRSDRTAAGLLWALKPADALVRFSQTAADANRPLTERAIAADFLAQLADPKAGEVLLELIDESTPPTLAKPALRGLAANIEGRWKSLAKGTDLVARIEPWAKNETTRADALKLAHALGTRPIFQWRLSPALRAEASEGFAKVFPPEETDSPEQAEDWITAHVNPDGMVDLARQLRPNSNVVGYAVALVQASEPLETKLLAGSDDGIKIWLNGRLVHQNNITRGAGPRQDTATARFEKGLNRMLVKVNQGTGGWAFVVEVEDPFRKLTEITFEKAPRLVADPKLRLDPAKLPDDQQLLSQSGNAQRGREVFFRSTAECAKCHSLAGAGPTTATLGPGLDGIGKKMGKDALLESIVRPEAKIAPMYEVWTIVTTAGRTHTGLIVEENPDRLVMVDAAGKQVALAKDEIDGKEKSPLSLMPQQLVGHLTPQDLADLLEYLVQQKGE